MKTNARRARYEDVTEKSSCFSPTPVVCVIMPKTSDTVLNRNTSTLSTIPNLSNRSVIAPHLSPVVQSVPGQEPDGFVVFLTSRLQEVPLSKQQNGVQQFEAQPPCAAFDRGYM